MNFQTIRTGSGIQGFRPCWCPSPFPLPSKSRCFSIHSSSPAIEFHSCLFFTTDVSALIGRPFTCALLGEFQAWDWLWYPMLCSKCFYHRGGAGVRMKQISRFKFLPWQRLNLGLCSLMAANVTTRLRHTPLYHIVII